jgi:enolase
MVKIKNILAKDLGSHRVLLSVGLDNGLSISEEISVDSNSSHNIQNTIHFVNNIVSPILIGLKPFYHKELDKMIGDLNHIHNQNNHEINVSLLLSMLLHKCGAISSEKSLIEYVNSIYQSDLPETERKPSIAYILATSDKGEESVDFKEFYLIPARYKTLKEGKTIISTIAATLAKENDTTESDIELNFNTNADVFQFFEEAIQRTHYKLNHDVYMGFNASSLDWYGSDGKYSLKDMVAPLSSEELTKYYLDLEKEYPQLIIESPFANTSWNDWTNLNNGIGDSALLSIPVNMLSDINELKKAVNSNCASAITIDFKYISTITTLYECAAAVLKSNWKIIIQNNSGINMGNFDIECALGIGTDFIKLPYSNNENIDSVINLISEYNEESSSAIS